VTQFSVTSIPEAVGLSSGSPTSSYTPSSSSSGVLASEDPSVTGKDIGVGDIYVTATIIIIINIVYVPSLANCQLQSRHEYKQQQDNREQNKQNIREEITTKEKQKN
jgi:hypothetical protein